MDPTKCIEIRDMLIHQFDREFRKGKAEVTFNKTVKYQDEQQFSLYYLLSEQLRNTDPVLYSEMLGFLTQFYYGRTCEDEIFQPLPMPAVTNEDLFAMLRETLDAEWQAILAEEIPLD